MSDYNGYTNWETWFVGVELDNNEVNYHCACGLAEGVGPSGVDALAQSFERTFIYVKEEMERASHENFPKEPIAPINWKELAQEYIDALEIKPEEPDSDNDLG